MKQVRRIKRARVGLASRPQRARGARTASPSGNGSRPRVRSRAGTTRKLRQLKTILRTARRTGHSRRLVQDSIKKQAGDAQHLAAVKNFEAGARYFQKQNYEKAKEIFEKLAAASAPPEVADRARLHLRLCQQRLGRSVPALKTAGDYYVLGVAELNARNLDVALEHLNKADKLEPNREHIRYALAAAHALQRNSDVALEHLKAAIALRPEDRFQARRDEDFESLAADPRFKSLVHP